MLYSFSMRGLTKVEILIALQEDIESHEFFIPDTEDHIYKFQETFTVKMQGRIEAKELVNSTSKRGGTTLLHITQYYPILAPNMLILFLLFLSFFCPIVIYILLDSRYNPFIFSIQSKNSVTL